MLCAVSVSARKTGGHCLFADGANSVYEDENLRSATGVDGGKPCRMVANKFCDRPSDASDFMGIGFRPWKIGRTWHFGERAVPYSVRSSAGFFSVRMLRYTHIGVG